LDQPGLNAAPKDRHEELFIGTVRTTAEGGFQFITDAGHWPVITLEPAINQWLHHQAGSSGTIRVRAVRNPWGPWLRLLGVIDYAS
jgi:hypothetical protein